MATAYRNTLNAIAFSQISKDADIPSKRLCIGDDEILENVPVLLFANAHDVPPRAILAEQTEKPYEQAHEMLYEGSVSIDDFPTDLYYIGDAIKGV